MRVSSAWRSRISSWLALGAMAAGAGCWSGKEIVPEPLPIENIITQVTVEGSDAIATLQADPIPSAAGGPIPTIDVQSPTVLGGSVRILATSPTPFTRVVMHGGPGVQGYWQLDLPAPVTSAALIVTVSQAFNFSPIPAQFSLAASGGPQGDYALGPIEVLRVGTGEVQVSATWDAQSDVDLHVIDPNGEELYYGNRTSTTNGELDLDSNAGCSIDGKRNENVTWPFGSAPHGTYTVRLDYWSSCAAPQTRWVVTVRVEGQPPQTFTGTFTGSGDAGGAGSGEQIVQFTY